ncbi:class I SAM-dependent methyltransferase [Bacillus cereus]|uniref:class I SAM-dependent methyltransferase n=1 Tax=Bacillus cereus TaxID=1396 RepID=UPI0014824B8A|nr:class I SAM-dependent methyltransferase [Bacillus cereus]
MKTLNFFTVGPTFEIHANLNREVNHSILFPCEFIITEKNNRIGRIMIEMKCDTFNFTIDKNILSLKNEEQYEIIKLISEIYYRLGNHQMPIIIERGFLNSTLEKLLLLDGFMKMPTYLISYPDQVALKRGREKVSSKEVYQDLYTVPWNFVPREFDVLDEFEKFATNKETKILDLGCGVGKNAILLEKSYKGVYGIDISPAAIKKCKELVNKPDNFIVGSAADIPFENSFFEFVLDIGCLHCMPTDLLGDAIVQIHRVLKDDGILFSRIFKPKPQSWLDKQPFKADKFGLTEADALNLFQDYFDVTIWKQDDDMNYIMCRKG